MNDLELTKACALAMGWELEKYSRGWRVRDMNDGGVVLYLIRTEGEGGNSYDPLRDDAQAMALVKRFSVQIFRDAFGMDNPEIIDWEVCVGISQPMASAHNRDLNRAICECVAKMREKK